MNNFHRDADELSKSVYNSLRVCNYVKRSSY
jgi:hypothetical protein